MPSDEVATPELINNFMEVCSISQISRPYEYWWSRVASPRVDGLCHDGSPNSTVAT